MSTITNWKVIRVSADGQYSRMSRSMSYPDASVKYLAALEKYPNEQILFIQVLSENGIQAPDRRKASSGRRSTDRAPEVTEEIEISGGPLYLAGGLEVTDANV